MINVIIVDDDTFVRKGLMKLIKWKELGAEVVLVAEDGKKVADVLNVMKVDLIISDVRMPFMDGIELSRHIKEHSCDISIVLLSAYAEFEYVKEAMKYGVREYILKPINRDKIQRLSNIISTIVKEKDHKVKLTSLLHDSEFKKNVRKALENNNIEYITKVMILGEDYNKTDIMIVREYYLILIDILMEFIESVGITSIQKQDILRAFMNESTTEGFIEFTGKQYMDVMHMRAISKKGKSSNVVNHLKKYIEDNYANKNINVNSISSHFNFTSTYLGLLFKEEEDMTLTEYLAKTRMEKAIKLLKETELPVHIIAQKVGYDDVNYFNRLFKKNIGMSPTEYRAEKIGDAD